MYLKEHGINNDFDIFEELNKKQEEKNNRKDKVLDENRHIEKNNLLHNKEVDDE